MEKFIALAKGWFFLCGGVLCLVVAGAAWHMDTMADQAVLSWNSNLRSVSNSVAQVATPLAGTVNSLAPVSKQLTTDLVTLNGDLKDAKQSIRILNNSCTPGPCGLLYDTARTLGTIRGTFGEIEIAAHHEDKNLDTLDTQEATLFRDTHDTLDSFSDDLDTFKTSLDKTNAILDNPFIAPTIQNVSESTGTLNHMLFTFDQVETKGTHDYLHPSKNPFARAWKNTEPFLLPAAKIGAAFAF